MVGLRVEIGLTLLNRINCLQANYDPLLSSHTILQDTYNRLQEKFARVDQNEEAWRKQLKEHEEESDVWEVVRQDLESKVETLKRDLAKATRSRDKLAKLLKLKDHSVNDLYKDLETEEEGMSALKKEIEVLKEESRLREQRVRDLISENALLKHQQMSSPRPEGDETFLDARKRRLLGQEQDSSALTQKLSRDKRSSLGSGFGHGSGVGLGLGNIGRSVSYDDRDKENSFSETQESQSNPRAKLRPLSLSLSISSNATHAGPSSLGSAAWATTSPHRFSLTPSLAPSVSSAQQKRARRQSSIRYSVSSTTSNVPGGWGDLARDADGVPLWPQPRSLSANNTPQIEYGDDTYRKRQWSGNERINYSVNGVQKPSLRRSQSTRRSSVSLRFCERLHSRA